VSKKNKPVSIYKNDTNFNKLLRGLTRGNAMTDQKFYKINGVEYAEKIDIDIANGNTGRSVSIEKFVVTPGTMEVKLVPVTDKEELEMLAKDPTRANVIGGHLNDLLAIEGAEEAFDASGMLEIAKGNKSWVGNIPLPPDQGGDANVDNNEQFNVAPAEIFGDYKTI